MEHWSKTSLSEPQPLGKHKYRERDDAAAGASRGGSGKVLKLLNVYPVSRKVPGAFSGRDVTQPAGKPKRREREEDDAGAFRGRPDKSLKTTKVSPASGAENGGFRSSGGGEETRRLSSASRRESTSVRRDWPSKTAPNVETRKISALSPPREGTSISKTVMARSSLAKKTGTSTSLMKIRKANTSLVKIGKAEAKKMEMVKNEKACKEKTKCQQNAITSASEPRTERKTGIKLQQKKWMQARKNVMMILNNYQKYCKLVEKYKSKLHLGRVDRVASSMLKKDFPRLHKKPLKGTVPGINVGERFTYRMELHLVGMHSPSQCGIDTMVDKDGNRIAISVVDSGGYENYMSSLETLVYCAQGSSIENQKQKAVNKAMIKSMEVKNPVRVIRTRKVHNSIIYIYDGLYTVEGMWVDRKIDGSRLKFKLVRNPGQPSSFFSEERTLKMKASGKMKGSLKD